jgi:hypothetical protein
MLVHNCNPSYLGGRERRTEAPGQEGPKLVRPHLKHQAECVPFCNPSYSEVGKLLSQASPGPKCEVLSEKQTKSKKDWGVAQVVEQSTREWEDCGLRPAQANRV